MIHIDEAMKTRHTVKKYIDKPLPESFVDVLRERIQENNKKYHVSLRLITNDRRGIPPIFRLLISKNVRNYCILASNPQGGLQEEVGYAGADIMLYAQTLGLNTWWVGSTYNKYHVNKLSGGNKVVGIIAMGYGLESGTIHKSKDYFDVAEFQGDTPHWFRNGVEAALLAPTSHNKQAFKLKGKDDSVEIIYERGLFSEVDKGIVKYHFEIGANTKFHWKK